MRLSIQLPLDMLHLTDQRFDLFEQKAAPQLLRQGGQGQLPEPGQPLLGPQRRILRRDDAGAAKERSQRILGPRALGDHLAAAVDQFTAGAVLRARAHALWASRPNTAARPVAPRRCDRSCSWIERSAAIGLVAHFETIGQVLEDLLRTRERWITCPSGSDHKSKCRSCECRARRKTWCTSRIANVKQPTAFTLLVRQRLPSYFHADASCFGRGDRSRLLEGARDRNMSPAVGAPSLLADYLCDLTFRDHSEIEPRRLARSMGLTK